MQSDRLPPSDPRKHQPPNGSLLATVLAGVWLRQPPKVPLSLANVEGLVPPLIGSGTAGLAWRAISLSPDLQSSEELQQLRNAYRHIAMQAALKSESLNFVVSILDSVNVEPLIFKGWAIARYYAEPDLRPFGDFDLCAPPGKHGVAAEVLSRHASSQPHGLRGLAHLPDNFEVVTSLPVPSMVDLHEDLNKYRTPDMKGVFVRSEQISLGKVTVRVPSLEDHLRLAIFHFLRHGGWRPLWLTDIAAMMAHITDKFDWRLCLGTEPRVERWIACVLELAHRLLGANISQVPAEHRASDLPEWVVKTILKEWQTPFAARHAVRPLSDAFANPRIFPSELRKRWSNPIRATTLCDGVFDNSPRLPYQLATFTSFAWGRVHRTMTQRFGRDFDAH